MLGILVALLTLFEVARRTVWRYMLRPRYYDPIKRAAEERQAAATAERIAPILQTYLAPIHAELQANGGKTVKDLTVRTAQKLDVLEVTVRQHLEYARQGEQKLDTIQDTLTKLTENRDEDTDQENPR